MVEHLVEERGEVVLVSPQGDLHTETVGDFQALIDELLRTDRQFFVIDFGNVSFIDSAGLGALVRLYKRVRIGEGDVRLARVSSNVMQIFDLTRLNRVFDIFSSSEEAVASIKQQD